jgi:hypothetical protein
LWKTHTPDYRLEISKRMGGTSKPMAGTSKPMVGKPVIEKVNQIIHETLNKPIFLYNSNTIILIQKYNSQRELIAALKMLSKTILKYFNLN